MVHAMVNGSGELGELMVESQVSRLVGSPVCEPDRCPRCGGYYDLFKNLVFDDCSTHYHQLLEFLQPGRHGGWCDISGVLHSPNVYYSSMGVKPLLVMVQKG